MSDDREKKSWREIDLARDRGITSKKGPSKSRVEIRADQMASKAAKQELEKLFSGSKLSKDKAARMKQIQELRGKPEFYLELTKYYQEYGLPHEWDAQILFLDHRDTGLVVEILGSLIKTAPKESLERQQLLASKLRVMEISSFDSKLLDKIKELKTSILAK